MAKNYLAPTVSNTEFFSALDSLFKKIFIFIYLFVCLFSCADLSCGTQDLSLQIRTLSCGVWDLVP